MTEECGYLTESVHICLRLTILNYNEILELLHFYLYKYLHLGLIKLLVSTTSTSNWHCYIYLLLKS